MHDIFTTRWSGVCGDGGGSVSASQVKPLGLCKIELLSLSDLVGGLPVDTRSRCGVGTCGLV